MEYLRGIDLLHLLQRNKRLSPERAGRLLGQMCSVLQAAHDQDIVGDWQALLDSAGIASTKGTH